VKKPGRNAWLFFANTVVTPSLLLPRQQGAAIMKDVNNKRIHMQDEV
jgi:hypothetical protein